jgi:hypothetical protein
MSRPIKETPILYGKDAKRFIHNMINRQKIGKEVLARMIKSYEKIKEMTKCQQNQK